MLIFFRWSGSENEDEERDGIDEAKEWLIRKQHTNYKLLIIKKKKTKNEKDQEILTITDMSSVNSRVLPSFLSCEKTKW